MPVKTESELPDNLRSLWLKAQSAYELKNFGYAITLLSTVLKDEPAFLEGRKLLRRAEVAQTRGKKSTFLGLDTSSLSGLKLGGKGMKDPYTTIISAEKALENDPYNESANFTLRDAALAANMPELATFALETLAEGHPKNTKIWHELGRHYTKLELYEQALNAYNRISALAPNDIEAVKLGKDAAARLSMRQEGWDSAQGGDYRKLIKNVDEAISLEQQSRVVKSEDMIDRQLAELHEKIEAEPRNVDLTRRYASLCEQREDFESALAWYQYSSDLAGGTDGGILRKIADCKIKIFEGQIRQLDEQLAAMAPDAPERSALEQSVARLRHERESIIIDEARKSVERNPTDLVLRFELGQHLVADQRFSEAIPELQKARNNPNTRIRATYFLGQCYEKKGMNDMAVAMYEEAARDYVSMDSLRKEILYHKALLHERLGQKDLYLDSLKQIYQVDYEYRDVAQRVEASYSA